MDAQKFTTSQALGKSLANKLAPNAAQADLLGAILPDDIDLLKSSGYLALNIPKTFGGYSLGMIDCIQAQLELAQGSAATALIAGMQMQVFGNEVENRSWSENHFETFCTAGANGGLFNSVASEPILGSPSRGGLPATTATHHSSETGWILNGHKTWVTGGKHLTHMLVRCQMEGEPAVVLVTQNQEGITWEETWKESLSLRSSESNDVLFTNVWIPIENVVERGSAKHQPNAWFPMVLGAVYLGSAIAARNTVIKYALERVPTALGRPIATLPKIQRQIGEIDIALQASQVFFLKVAEDWTNAEDKTTQMSQIAAAKHLVVETARHVTEKALEIAGGISLSKTLPLERYFRDVRAGMMQPPAGDTALEIVGRSAVETYHQSISPDK